MSSNIFLGLQPYKEENALIFKGRFKESRELFRLIVRNDYSVCYAESGEGKTSLLNAGVFPRLREDKFFPIRINFTNDDFENIPDSFDEFINKRIEDSIEQYNKEKGVNYKYVPCSEDFLELDEELKCYLWWKLRNYKLQADGKAFTPVFVFDQFEEVFTMPKSPIWTKKFFKWLEVVSLDICPKELIGKIREIIGPNEAFPEIKERKDFKAVFSLRKEFIGELDYWGMQQCFIPELKNNRFCLKPLTYEGAKEVMSQQNSFQEDLSQQNSFQEDFIEKILGHWASDAMKEENLPVIPALLLSVVCDTCEKNSIFSFSDNDNIEQLLTDILDKFYEESMNAIKEHSRISRNDIDKIVFSLVDDKGRRERVKAASSVLEKAHFDDEIKKTMSDNRIIKIIKIDNEDYVELVHDSICPIVEKRKNEKSKAKSKRNVAIVVIVGLFLFCFAGCQYWINKANWNMMEEQSRFVAEKVSRLIDEGDILLSQLLLLEVLPKDIANPNRPYVAEAEAALRRTENEQSYILCNDKRLIGNAGNGSLIASIDSSAKELNVWNIESGNLVHHYSGDSIPIFSASYSPNQREIALVYGDGGRTSGSPQKYKEIAIINANTGKLLKLFKGHTAEVENVIYSADGKYLASNSWDGTIRLWDVIKGKNIKVFSGDSVLKPSLLGRKKVPQVSHCLGFSPNGKRLISHFGSDGLEVWDTETGDCIDTLKVNSVNCINYSPDGKLLAAASNEVIKIWDMKNNKLLKELSGHSDIIWDVSFSKDSKFVVSSSGDNTVRIWDIEKGECIRSRKFDADRGGIMKAVFSLDGQKIVFSPLNRGVRIWKWRETPSYFTIPFNWCAFSSNGNIAVFANKEGNVAAWDIINKKRLFNLRNSSRVNGIDYSSSGKYILTMGDSPFDNKAKIYIWDAKTGGLIKELSVAGYFGACSSVFQKQSVFSPDGICVATVEKDATIGIFNINTGECVKSIKKGIFDIIQYSPNGKFLVAAYLEGHEFYLIKVDNGEIIQTFLIGYQNNISCVNFTKDENTLITGTSDGKIKLWNIQTGKCVKDADLGAGSISSLSLSKDEKYIISVSDGKYIKVIDKKSWICMSTFESQELAYASMLDDNRTIVSATYDGLIQYWDFPPIQELIDDIRNRFKGK